MEVKVPETTGSRAGAFTSRGWVHQAQERKAGLRKGFGTAETGEGPPGGGGEQEAGQDETAAFPRPTASRTDFQVRTGVIGTAARGTGLSQRGFPTRAPGHALQIHENPPPTNGPRGMMPTPGSPDLAI